MIDEIKQLERRAFWSWEGEFTPRLIEKHGLIRVGCATFTMTKAKHTKTSAFRSIMDDYFYGLAKKQDRHFIHLFGTPSIGAQERRHQHGDTFILESEGTIKDLESYRWLLEASFRFGRCEISEKRAGGNWSGYSVAKHDGNDDFLKIYCPKTGECGRHTKRKGDRRFCVYQRQAFTLK